MKKIFNLLEKFFWIIFTVFSFGIGIIVWNYNLKLAPSSPLSNTTLFFSALILLLLFFLMHLLIKIQGLEDELNKWFVFPLLFIIISLMIKLAVFIFLGEQTQQVSDFEFAFSTAKYNSQLTNDYLKIITSWTLYIKYLSLVGRFLELTTEHIILLNIFWCILSELLIYYILLLNTNNVALSTVAVVLYLVWPIQNFYILLLTPEFLNILLMLFTILLLSVAFKKVLSGYTPKAFLYLLLASISLRLSGFFKGIDIVMLIALFILLFLKYYDFKKSITIKLVFAGLTFGIGIYILTGNLIWNSLDNYIAGNGNHINRNIVPYYLSQGLNFQNWGSWNPEVTAEYLELARSTNYDFDIVNSTTLSKIVVELSNNRKNLIPLLLKKFDAAWSNASYFEWITATINPSLLPLNYHSYSYKLSVFSQWYYFIIVIGVIVGNIISIIKKPNSLILLCGIFSFGFLLLLLLTEVQPRYKCVLYPYLAILSANGFFELFNLRTNLFVFWKRLIRYSKGVANASKSIR